MFPDLSRISVIGGFLIVLGLVLYWLLIITEGTYLGQRVVTLLYDIAAEKYDSIKSYDARLEAVFLGQPLAAELSNMGAPLVLDIATGTGRLPLTLLEQPTFQGRIVGADHSRQMIRLAAHKVRPFSNRIMLLWLDAMQLPFPNNSFDAVTALEMLEFTPNPRQQITEAIRVLKPGGILLTTRRTGFDAHLMPGKTFSQAAFRQLLNDLGLSRVTIETWQVDYDLVWAVLEGDAVGKSVNPLEILQCKQCRASAWNVTEHTLMCEICSTSYKIRQGVIEMAR